MPAVNHGRREHVISYPAGARQDLTRTWLFCPLLHLILFALCERPLALEFRVIYSYRVVPDHFHAQYLWYGVAESAPGMGDELPDLWNLADVHGPVYRERVSIGHGGFL